MVPLYKQHRDKEIRLVSVSAHTNLHSRNSTSNSNQTHCSHTLAFQPRTSVTLPGKDKMGIDPVRSSHVPVENDISFWVVNNREIK